MRCAGELSKLQIADPCQWVQPMSLYIQDPNDPKGMYLLEALLEACQGANAGGGAFAFVSAAGVKLFLDDEGFKAFASKNPFDLVLGVDGITNLNALKAIQSASDACSGLKPRVFMPGKVGTIFHPKFCWFRKAKGGVLITGSGNLTRGGLRWNVEAFTWQILSGGDIKAIGQLWKDFQSENSSRLKLLDDPSVLKRAEANDAIQRIVGDARKKIELPEEKNRDPEKAETRPDPSDEVLIAEIPQAGDRWKQANFHKETFENFFGAKPGVQHRIFLFYVGDDGTLGDREVRPSVSVKSKNFRFELDAASGLAYPNSGRPIGVFIRMATRTFRYRLLMPDNADHKRISHYLNSVSPAKGNKMRETIITAQQLRKIWPDATFWKAA